MKSNTSLRALASLALAALVSFSCSCAGVGLSTTGVSLPGGGQLGFDSITKAAGAVRKGFQEITDSEEYYIGRTVAAKIIQKYQVVNDPGATKYITEVGLAVAYNSDRPATYGGYHFTIIKSDEINAFAAPGGFIFITTGLLKNVSSEDELGNVLAHEVAHVAKKHGLSAIKSSRLTEAFSILAVETTKAYTPAEISQLVGAFEGVIDDIVTNLIVKGYSRDQEYDADKFGMIYASNTAYSPGAMKTFIEKLESISNDKTGGFFSTHPQPQDRLGKLNATLKGLKQWPVSPARTARFERSAKL